MRLLLKIIYFLIFSGAQLFASEFPLLDYGEAQNEQKELSVGEGNITHCSRLVNFVNDITCGCASPTYENIEENDACLDFLANRYLKGDKCSKCCCLVESFMCCGGCWFCGFGSAIAIAGESAGKFFISSASFFFLGMKPCLDYAFHKCKARSPVRQNPIN
jgi:hypothetical protein